VKKTTLIPGVIVERVGDDLMVIVPGNNDVVSLSGRPADVLADVQEGRVVDPSEPALKTLNDLGIVTSPGMSRRGLITAGALGAGAGVVMLSMPAAAAAGSGPEGANGDDDYDAPSADPITFNHWGGSASRGQVGPWTVQVLMAGEGFGNVPDRDPDAPTPEDGTSGIYTTESDIVVAVTYNAEDDWWEGQSNSTTVDSLEFYFGVLTFSDGVNDYVGVMFEDLRF